MLLEKERGGVEEGGGEERERRRGGGGGSGRGKKEEIKLLLYCTIDFWKSHRFNFIDWNPAIS